LNEFVSLFLSRSVKINLFGWSKTKERGRGVGEREKESKMRRRRGESGLPSFAKKRGKGSEPIEVYSDFRSQEKETPTKF
jgi:hypothetical protein